MHVLFSLRLDPIVTQILVEILGLHLGQRHGFIHYCGWMYLECPTSSLVNMYRPPFWLHTCKVCKVFCYHKHKDMQPKIVSDHLKGNQHLLEMMVCFLWGSERWQISCVQWSTVLCVMWWVWYVEAADLQEQVQTSELEKLIVPMMGAGRAYSGVFFSVFTTSSMGETPTQNFRQCSLSPTVS